MTVRDTGEKIPKLMERGKDKQGQDKITLVCSTRGRFGGWGTVVLVFCFTLSSRGIPAQQIDQEPPFSFIQIPRLPTSKE